MIGSYDNTIMRACLFLLITFVLSCHSNVYAQDKGLLSVQEDSLYRLGKDMFISESEPDRLKNNFAFVKTLVRSLKTKHSFDYPFSRLDMISILNDPKGKFRVFSWNIPLHDGSYLYFGSIQFRTPSGELKLIPLIDKTFDIQNPETAILSSEKWYGAQYYDIRAVGDSYVLLGWKGHSAEYSQKVIEVLHVEGEKVSFGKPLFSEDESLRRRVFYYTKQASMYLQYNEQDKAIYFDHIVPLKPELTGQYKYYGPDLSHDGYRIKNKGLEFVENVELKNSR